MTTQFEEGRRLQSTSAVAIITPSFSRDFGLCRELNESVLRHTPSSFRHYIIVDRSDVSMFKQLDGGRTVVIAIEDVIPGCFFKVPGLKRWLSLVSRPVKGWLIQQIVKVRAATLVTEPITVNVDSDVQFIRNFDACLFIRDGKTRLFRNPKNIRAGMIHVKMHDNMSRLLGLPKATLPTDDYVGNVISWNRQLVGDMCAYIEQRSGLPWYVMFANGCPPAEYLAYGLYVDKIVGVEKAWLFVDESPWCHTYWGPAPLSGDEAIEAFAAGLEPSDVAVSIEGYTRTERAIEQSTIMKLRALAAFQGHAGYRRD